MAGENQRDTRKEDALKKVGDEYYDANSPHYKDNERYEWAVNAINEQFPEESILFIDTKVQFKSCMDCHYSSKGQHGCNRLMRDTLPKIDKTKGLECAYNGYVHYIKFGTVTDGKGY